MSQPTFQVTLTAQQFANLSAQLKGMNLGKDYLRQGTLPETRGVQLAYVVTGMASGMSLVTFTVVKKPFLVPVSAIRSHIQQMIGADHEEA